MIMGDKTLLRFHKVDKNHRILSKRLLIRIRKQLRKKKHLSSLTREPALIVCSTIREDQSTNPPISHRGLLQGTSNKSVRAQVKKYLTTQLIELSKKSLSLQSLQAKIQTSITLRNRCKNTKSIYRASSIRVTVLSLCITNTKEHLFLKSLLKTNKWVS